MEMDYADERHPSERYHEKSHGESFLAIAQRHLRPNGLYLLDEPEAAQSIENAVAQVLTQARTRDIYTEDSGCKLVGCQEMGSLTAGLI